MSLPGPAKLAESLHRRERVVALLPGYQSEGAQRLAPDIAGYLERKGIQTEREPEPSSRVGLVLSLGGDGLMMRAARRYPNAPILGINFGHFGFLTAVEAGDWRHAVDQVLDGAFLMRVDPTLATRVVRRNGVKEELGWAVNDVVVHGGLRYIDPELSINQQFVNDYPGDGMVVSTPAGSTAYCMAAGGPVLLSGVAGFAIVPMNCHSPIRVSLVVPEDVDLSIKLDGRHPAHLILDGQAEQHRELEPGDAVEVRKGPVSFRHVSFRSFDWFAAFQSKFNYRIRERDEPSGASGERA